MSELKPGQRVRIELEGVIPEMGGGCDASFITRRHPEYETFNSGRLYVKSLTNFKVTVLDSADWPPRVGDIWEAEGREWAARDIYDDNPNQVVLTVLDYPGLQAPPIVHQHSLDDFKALNPALVRRRGQ